MARPPTPMAIPSGSPNAITKGLPSVSSAHGPFFALMSGARSPESFLSRASANHLETDPLKPASSRSCRSAWSSCHRLQPSQQPTAIRTADSPHKPSTGVSTGVKASSAQASFVPCSTSCYPAGMWKTIQRSCSGWPVGTTRTRSQTDLAADGYSRGLALITSPVICSTGDDGMLAVLSIYRLRHAELA